MPWRDSGSLIALVQIARTIRKVLPDLEPPSSSISVASEASSVLASRCFWVRLKLCVCAVEVDFKSAPARAGMLICLLGFTVQPVSYSIYRCNIGFAHRF